MRSPWLALIAALPFVAASPVLASGLLETLGGSVEPFLYVLALWALRDRPLAFGLVLCLGFLHREFTIFAVLAVGVGTAFEQRTADARDRPLAVAGGRRMRRRVDPGVWD